MLNMIYLQTFLLPNVVISDIYVFTTDNVISSLFPPFLIPYLNESVPPCNYFLSLNKKVCWESFFLKFCISLWTHQKCLTLSSWSIVTKEGKSTYYHELISLLDDPSIHAREIRIPELKSWMFVKWELNWILDMLLEHLFNVIKRILFFKRKNTFAFTIAIAYS